MGNTGAGGTTGPDTWLEVGGRETESIWRVWLRVKNAMNSMETTGGRELIFPQDLPGPRHSAQLCWCFPCFNHSVNPLKN